MLVAAAFVFVRGTNVQRIALACLVPVTLVAAVIFVSSGNLTRIQSFSGQDASAEASTGARRYLLTKAIEYTFEYPLFGVGPGQFATYEGTNNRVIGTHGLWHGVHNSFLAAFVETGVPGGLFYLAGYLSLIFMLNRAYRKARSRPDCKDIQDTLFCVLLGVIAFSMAIFFLNFTYLFYGPALGGVAISMSRAAEYEFGRRSSAVVLPQSLGGVQSVLPAIAE